MNILMYKVGRPPEVIEVECELHAMQELVDGNLEVIVLEESFILIADEEGILKGKPVNRNVYMWGQPRSVVGDFFICKAAGESFVGLTDEEAIYAATHFIYDPYKN